jgi:hypothetical protein
MPDRQSNQAVIDDNPNASHNGFPAALAVQPVPALIAL